jgi:hypothetical protein
MTDEQINNLKTRLVAALMTESLDAYFAGQQNCPGPIPMSDAEAIISEIFDQVLDTNQEV